jgi:hypothetical protein
LAHVIACPKTPVVEVAHLLPQHYRDTLEHNQLLASCCRDTSGHEIEARYSSEWVRDHQKVPDIYIFTCSCGRHHRRFCMGNGDTRPFWE